ncbi:MAG: AzlC family ABC transporter permease [Pseudonocardia sediminis]
MSSAERTRRSDGRPPASWRGADVRDAVALSVAVGVVGVSFGALAPAAGLSPLMTMAMSVLVFAGGAQLLVTGVLAAGGGLVAAVVAGLVLNLRHLPFGLALAGTIGRGPSRFLGAHVVTDESTAFVLARSEDPARARRAFWTLGTIKFTCWQAGTALGLLLGTAIPDPSVFGLDAAFPAALLAMLFPMLRRADARRVGGAAAVVALTASPFAPAGVPVLAGLLGLGLAGRGGERAGAAASRAFACWERVHARAFRTIGGRS